MWIAFIVRRGEKKNLTERFHAWIIFWILSILKAWRSCSHPSQAGLWSSRGVSHTSFELHYWDVCPSLSTAHLSGPQCPQLEKWHKYNTFLQRRGPGKHSACAQLRSVVGYKLLLNMGLYHVCFSSCLALSLNLNSNLLILLDNQENKKVPGGTIATSVHSG